MTHRRTFLKSVLGAVAGVYALGPDRPATAAAAVAQTAPARRQVTIGGRRVRVVDIHAHVTVPEVVPLVKGTPNEGNAAARPLSATHIAQLDKHGIDIQALSINNFWWYEIQDRSLADRIARAQNEGLAKLVAEHTGRLVVMASTSLQFPDLAARQLEDAVKQYGFRAAAVGGHVNLENLSAPKFDPFWAKAAELGLVVFMHPNEAHNLVKEGALGGRGELANIIGNPLETTHFLSRLIFDGTFDRFPSLKVAAAHGGGYLPSYLGRTEVTCDIREAAKCANKKRPSEYLRSQVLVDTMVFSDEGLRHLVNEMGVGQVVYGTDIPFYWPPTLDLVLNARWLSDADKEAIVGGNLIRLLQIT